MQSFRVHGTSMEPTLFAGQRLIVERVSYRWTPPQAGQVVVFRYPSDSRRLFVKRLIGLPGDKISIRSGFVWVNGQSLHEPYVEGPTHGGYRPELGPVIVPEDSYFFLGDNRRNSDDSRYPDVGFVPKELIVGRAVFCYWPPSLFGPVVPFHPRPREG